MFGKLVVIIIVLGAVACALLVQRQQRIDLAAEMSRTHVRLRQHERALWRLRADIAYATRPERIRDAIAAMPVEWTPIPGRMDRERGLGGALEEPRLADETTTQPVPRGDRQEYGG